MENPHNVPSVLLVLKGNGILFYRITGLKKFTANLKIQETQNPGNSKSGKLKIWETQNLGNQKFGELKIQERKLLLRPTTNLQKIFGGRGLCTQGISIYYTTQVAPTCVENGGQITKSPKSKLADNFRPRVVLTGGENFFFILLCLSCNSKQLSKKFENIFQGI